jgi:hypothetical protein
MPGAFPRRPNPTDRFVDRRSHVGMRVVAEVPQIGCQIARADEEAIDTLDRGNRVDAVQRLTRLDLDDDADFVVGALQIVFHPPVLVRPRRRRHTPDAGRRIARRGDLPGLASAALCTNGTTKLRTPMSSSRLNSTASFHDGPHDHARRVPLCRLQQAMNVGHVVRRMSVSSSIQSKPAPATIRRRPGWPACSTNHLRLAGAQRRFQRVHGQFRAHAGGPATAGRPVQPQASGRDPAP